jgi:hypothetical protein
MAVPAETSAGTFAAQLNGSSRYGDGRLVDQVIERQLRRLFNFHSP